MRIRNTVDKISSFRSKISVLFYFYVTLDPAGRKLLFLSPRGGGGVRRGGEEHLQMSVH